MGIRLRVASPSDEVSIGVLMAELMPHADTARRYDWLYRSNPHGAAVTVLATDEDSGELVGMTSAFPRRMQVRDRIVLGALGGDGWVRPQFRRRGIGSLLHLASRAAQAARGIQMMFGTPSPANATALRMAGGRDVASLRRWVRPLFGRPWRHRCSARLVAAEPGDVRLDAAWTAFARESRIATVRDSEFLRWRFQDAPSAAQTLWVVQDARGTVLGSCALETRDRRVRVIDLVACRERIPLVMAAIRAESPDAVALEMRLDDTTARACGLWRRGFIPRERIPLNVLMSSTVGWDDTSLANSRDWFSTWADSDLDTTWRSEQASLTSTHSHAAERNLLTKSR